MWVVLVFCAIVAVLGITTYAIQVVLEYWFLFLIAVVGLCIYLYVKHEKEEEESKIRAEREAQREAQRLKALQAWRNKISLERKEKADKISNTKFYRAVKQELQNKAILYECEKIKKQFIDYFARISIDSAMASIDYITKERIKQIHLLIFASEIRVEGPPVGEYRLYREPDYKITFFSLGYVNLTIEQLESLYYALALSGCFSIPEECKDMDLEQMKKKKTAYRLDYDADYWHQLILEESKKTAQKLYNENKNKYNKII